MPLPVILFLLALFAQAGKPTNELPAQFRGPYHAPPLQHPYKARFSAMCAAQQEGSLRIEQKKVPDGWREVVTVPLGLGAKSGEVEFADPPEKIIFLFLLLDSANRQLADVKQTVNKAALRAGEDLSLIIGTDSCIVVVRPEERK